MKGNCKTLFRKFCLESSVLGLKYFYLYPDPLSRCFWAVSMVLTLFFSFLLTLFLYNRFADMPTRFAIESQSVKDILYYPAITVCTPSQVTLSAVDHLKRTLVDGNTTIDLKNILPLLLGFYELYSKNEMEEILADFQNLISLNRYNVPLVMSLLPQSCDDFLKLCYLKGRRHDCSDLFRPVLTGHGMCCVFNSVYEYDNERSLRNKRVSASDFVEQSSSTGGFAEALTVVTDYNPDNALSGTLLLAGSTRILFTNCYDFPVDDESSLVPAHSESFHFISSTYTYCSEDVEALPYWSRQCYFFDEHHQPHFMRYHNSDCNLLCVTRAIERRCRCSMHFLPHVKQSRVCNITNINCIVDTKKHINKWTEPCLCMRDCISVRFKVEVSVGNLKALPYMIHEPYSGIQFNKSTSILHFIVQNSGHVKQRQETFMSLITVSSNLGGVFGLCLGCSMISVLEIIFYIYYAIKNRIQEHLKNKVDIIHHETERPKNKRMKTFRNFNSKRFSITPIDKEY